MSLTNAESEDSTVYKVVVNHEEQYSIWPDYKEIPAGWKHAGKTGPKAECLAHIKEVWTDMRPLSLRKKMEEFASNPPPGPVAAQSGESNEKSLADRLCEAEQLVEVGLRPQRTVKLFKEAVDRNYVHIKFLQTNGGTELGFRLDRDASLFTGADFENGKGTAHVEGDLTLDYVRVRCVADIDLSTLQGKGHLVRLDPESKSLA